MARLASVFHFGQLTASRLSEAGLCTVIASVASPEASEQIPAIAKHDSAPICRFRICGLTSVRQRAAKSAAHLQGSFPSAIKNGHGDHVYLQYMLSSGISSGSARVKNFVLSCILSHSSSAPGSRSQNAQPSAGVPINCIAFSRSHTTCPQ